MRLAQAVLEDALMRIGGGNPEGEPKAARDRHALEARAWLEAEDDEADALGFDSCCRALGLSPSAVRRSVREGRLDLRPIVGGRRARRGAVRSPTARGTWRCAHCKRRIVLRGTSVAAKDGRRWCSTRCYHQAYYRAKTRVKRKEARRVDL